MRIELSAAPADGPPALRAWVTSVFRQIANALAAPHVSSITLDIRSAEPARIENGMLVYADGTNWNPGGTGAGAYLRVSGAWVKL